MAFSKKTAILVWAGLTSAIWIGYISLRLTVGGTCPTHIEWELQKDFNTDKYLGRWHEMFRHKDVPYEYADCSTATYSKTSLNRVQIDNREYELANKKWARNNDFPLGQAIVSGWREGLVNVKFFELAPWANYMVLETDYTTYSIVYNCDDFAGGSYKDQWLWVLTRDALLVDSAEWITMRDKVFAVIKKKVGSYINPETVLYSTKQTTGIGCVYAPVP